MEVEVQVGDRGEMGILGKDQRDFTWEKGVMRGVAEGESLWREECLSKLRDETVCQ